MINRRDVMTGATASFFTLLSTRMGWAGGVTFSDLLDLAELNETELAQARGAEEWKELVASGGIAAGISNGPLSKTPVSPDAVRMIVMFEVTSEKAYTMRYQRPVWPRGASGVTFGIGYDIGYVQKQRLSDDWKDFIDDKQIDYLSKACGVTGKPAKTLTRRLQDVSVPYAVAYKEFNELVLPRFVGVTENALLKDNTDRLSAASLGALVSLTYNRGPSFTIPEAKDPRGRYREMRNIRHHLFEKKPELIPAEIRSMKRIWEGNPDMAGLLVRRELEAKLFESGLS
ncbi:exported hypothetical protein [Mesorhizobium sp. ORS 3324]|nr:exported hypothetical protein [Mesorhizobium sp. ORS 3324]